MNKLTVFLMMAFCLTMSACESPKDLQREKTQVVNSNGSTNQPRNSPSNVSANFAAITPSVASVNAPPKTGKSVGKITKINLELGSVELDHEEIPGMMPKMLMEFFVKDKKMLDGLKVGDTADFVLEENKGQEQIIDIKKKK